MGFWQTDPLGGDYCLRTFLQRGVCNEQQRNQRRAHDRKIKEDMHNHAPTCRHLSTFRYNYLRSAIDELSWTMDSQTYTSV